MISYRIFKNSSKRIEFITFGVTLLILFCGGFLGCSNQIPTKASDQSPSTMNRKIAGSYASGSTFPIPTDIAWGDGQLWEFMAPTFFKSSHLATPANDQSNEPLYIVAPNDPANPLAPNGDPGLGLGPHDHVIPVPPHNQGSFSGNWDVVVVLKPEYKDATAPFTTNEYAGPFKNAEAVRNAVNSGDAFLHDTGFDFTCPVRLYSSW